MFLSITKKTAIMIIAFALFLIATSVIIFSRVIINTQNESYQHKANELSRTVAQVIDVDQFMRLKDSVLAVYDNTENKVSSDQWGSDEFNAYSDLYNEVAESDDHIGLRDYLRDISDINAVDCIYLAIVDAENESIVILVDSALERPCPPGCIDKMIDDNRDVITDPEHGLDAYFWDTEEYGNILSAGAPIKDGSGNIVGYVMVDIQVNDVRAMQRSLIVRFTIPQISSLVLICVVGILIVNRIFVKPIKELSDIASDYCKTGSAGDYDGFAKLKISSGDEIESLAEAMKRMEHDLNDHFNEVLAAKGEAKRSRHIADEMKEKATTDSLTGVRNKTAFDSEAEILDEEIEKGRARFGIVMIDLNGLKNANDTYGHKCGDEMIKALSSLVCDTFVHSPVFRIGGDEFVVIAQDGSYDDIDDLISELNGKIEEKSSDQSLKPWLRVSAAVGYSAFDPKADKNVAEVFRHADEAMYERKREMKNKK